MESYQIDGGVPLRGEYRVKGAKNAALPILAATLCKAGVYELYDCPKIGDVFAMLDILHSLGAHTHWEDECLVVDSRNLSECTVSKEKMQQIRSSVFLLGSLLTRCGEATIHRPGGCRIGKRPIDIHINGLEELGFQVSDEDGTIRCSGTCCGGEITLPYPSVGATENLIMAALSGKKDTIIKNCATEPEIADFAEFLKTCGFQVHGAGTDTIFIQGGAFAHRADVMYFIMEDRIEAATYMMAVLGTGGKAAFRNIRPELMKSVFTVLERMGARIRASCDVVEVSAPRNLNGAGFVVTEPYPGFPTDCQPQLLTLATAAKGLTTIREEIFESRFTHKKELIKMGANIEICGKNAIIKGITPLRGAEVEAYDLRGGAALAMAALMAQGRSEIKQIEHISRGYEDFEEGIRSLGGLIERKKYEEKKKTYEPVS